MTLNPKSAGTEAIYKKAIERFVAAVGDRDVRELTGLDGQRYAAFMAAARHNGHPLSPTTINMQTRCIKALFNWMIAVDVLEKSPVRGIKALREVRRGHVPYEDPELDRILRACPDDRWRLIVVLAMTAGLRRGEILNLTVSEIDYLTGVITILEKSDTSTTWAWKPKDYESRQLPINGLCEQYLLRVQASLPDSQPYVTLVPRRYRHVMTLSRGGYMHEDLRRCPVRNFTRTFHEICRRAGVTCRTFHALRGTALTVMAENGLQPHELQQIAGHSSVQTTYRHYVRPRMQYLQNARQAAFSGRYRT